uniref:NAD-dependent epimerase/dehydratase domain-containing protein n=1 Tax=Cacopsylla melanoneura TaxID=428564 RepID=A0A8D9DUS7_9HEMI
MSSAKPTVVVLGGCGFIGRNLVEYLIENDLVSKLRVIDKVSPEIAWLNEKQKTIFNHPLVEFVSGNLVHPATCELLFLNSAGSDSNLTWEYVINCAAETRPGQPDQIYKEGIYKLSVNCATAAARYGILKYVEISTGEICSSNKHKLKESDDHHPSSLIAKYKVQVEKALHDIPGLNFTIVRPGLVYGKSDRHNIGIY